MIRSKKELEFYIKADRIMAGCDEWSLRDKIYNKLYPPQF